MVSRHVSCTHWMRRDARFARTAAILALAGMPLASCSSSQDVEADRAAIERTNALTLRALNDGDPDVRAAAAYAMAARRDQELLGALEPSVKSEPDAETKRWLEQAMTVLSQRGDLAGFERLRRKILKEPTRGLPDMGRGRNRGGRQGGGEGGGERGGG